ncbi:hypothetical protein [Shewanella sp. DC2-4]|uniref:PFGI-1 class ICE element type IV pilus protein PilL2 n=1 Tax=Shewanella sp. DC2-4 TaxID=2739431 RepID=UPI001C26732B|nr:hypothetical protein [Shewanella sp. DC2-4]
MRTPIVATVAALVITGCVNAPPAPPRVEQAPLNIRVAPDVTEIGATIYSSRYVTESSVPARQVRDVLSNEMNVNIPQLPNATVGQGLDFLLGQTGYRVRPPLGYAEEQLYQQPLPIVHMNMGYMSVRQALQVMGGEPWALEEDVVKREVGFKLREGYVWSNPSSQNSNALTASVNTLPVEIFTMNEDVSSHVADPTRNAEFESMFSSAPSSVNVGAESIPLQEVAASAFQQQDLAQRYYVVAPGSNYLSSLRQWMQDDNLAKVAWHLPPKTQQALSQVVVNGQTLTGTSLDDVVTKLSKEINEPLYLSHYRDMSAVHSYPGIVDIVWVSGDSLKQAVASVITTFGWQWQDANWLAIDDYQFLSSYPIVAPRGDIAHALEQVLTEYPVQAQLIYGTQQAFISEKQ